jgi:UDP-glucuronate 4-epimerase
MSDRILVTGGAGFIGSSYVDHLVAAGRDVAVIDEFNDYYSPAIKRANLAGVADRIQLVEADFCELAAWADLNPDDFAAVVHLGARAGVRPSLERPLQYTRTNLGGTTAALNWAISGQRPVPFVFASSSSVYGDENDVPFSESDEPAPISPYGATKAAGERLVEAWRRCYGLPVVSLRFFTVYGPRQRPDLAIHKFSRIIEAGGTLPMFGDGSAARDYTHIDDIVAGVRAAMDGVMAGTLPHRVYNLGSDRTIRLDAMIEAVATAVGKPANIERLPMQQGDVKRTWADLTRTRAELDYAPSMSFEDGLAGFVDWMRAHPL